MSELGSVSIWLQSLPHDKQEATRQLWERYYGRLVTFVRNKLRSGPSAARDEEDIALSAFACFCENAEKGRFPKLNDRDDLWQILVTIAKHKLYDYVQQESAGKRDYRKTIHALSANCPPETEAPVLLQVISDEPSPELVVEVADSFRQLMGALGEDKYRKVALLKFEGYSNAEIAKEIDRSERAVSHRLDTIRAIWNSLMNR